MLKRLSIFLALAGILAVTLLVLRLKKPEPTPVPLVEPSRAPYADSIGARGIVEAVNENVIVAPILPGLIMDIFVKVGDQVKKSDPLFRQDTRDAAAKVSAQQAQVALLEAQVKEAEVKVEDKKDDLARADRLLSQRVISEDVQKRKYFDLQAAESGLGSTRANLLLAGAQLRQAEVTLELLTVRAPRDGEILRQNMHEGEYAGVSASDQNAPSLLLGETSHLQLRADVDEDSASRVIAGAPAVAYIKGMRSDPIPLRFVRIEPYITVKKSLTGDSSERVDTRVLQVIYQFDKTKVPVYVGQQMDVFIDGAPQATNATPPREHTNSVIILPSSATP
ncbi:MAG: biotin/lipoyl-binding protein [Verrucomicrobiota bacterium]|jgi:multidrug efflux pump subunit AcrA (membrane-fusion protein)